MRQAGIIAAAGIVALETMVDRLADDHARGATARRRARRAVSRVASIPTRVRTNIVCAATAALPGDILPKLAAAGILAGTIDPQTIRFITHKDVDDDAIARVCEALP